MIYRAFFRLVLRRLDPERTHRLAELTMRALGLLPGARALLDWLLRPRDPGLHVALGDLELRSPLCVPAGVDKNAAYFDELGALGWGAVEVGTITALPQEGNPKPRVARVSAHRALINSMGFPNEGAITAARRLRRRRGPVAIGANIGKSRAVELEHAAEDYRASAREVGPLADFLVLNVSSPNTPQLRELQTVENLRRLIEGVRKELQSSCPGRTVPLMIKLSPDLPDSQIEELANLALQMKLGGIVAVNTTVRRDISPETEPEIGSLPGGLSGPPLKQRALEVLRLLHDRTQGAIPLVSVGGIETAADAWERILAGATLVQAYTGFVYGGPLWPHRVNRGLSRCLRESPWDSIADAIGKGTGPTEPRRKGRSLGVATS
jgi:dihydroorotate dehydrogenase